MKFLVAAITLAATSMAYAGSSELEAVKHQNTMLGLQLDTCAIGVRTMFVLIRSKDFKAVAEGQAELNKCVADGKASAKTAYDEVRGKLGKRKSPEQLTDWRLDWMAAFDAAMPQDTDIERVYLQRVGDAKRQTEKATNKLEIALEK